jgi:chromosome segregation ATPase
MHNKPIASRIEAWLTFFSSEKPEDVLKLIEAYPEFKPMYEEVYALCKNTERVIDMFSEELYELDKNTVKFMMDEMQEEIDGLKEQNDGLKEQVNQRDEVIAKKDDMIAKKEGAIAEKDIIITTLQQELERMKTQQK